MATDPNAPNQIPAVTGSREAGEHGLATAVPGSRPPGPGVCAALNFVLSGVIIGACLGLGEVTGALVARLAFPIPGSVLGMLWLLGALRTGLVRLPRVERGADWLLEYLGLFFVPAGVGLLARGHELSDYWPAIVGSTVLSTLLVLAVTGGVAQRLGNRRASDAP